MKISSILLSLTMTTILSGCVIDPSAWPMPENLPDNESNNRPNRELVNHLDYANGSIAYFSTANSSDVRDDKIRICLKNQTEGPKFMHWTKGPSTTNSLSAPRNGSRSCANFALHQRVEWVFIDHTFIKKTGGMNLGSNGGTLIEFVWERDS